VFRTHGYAPFESILSAVVDDGLLATNLARIRGAGTARPVHKACSATIDELAMIAAAMLAEYQLLVVFAAWLGLRFGEVIELCCRDLDLKPASSTCPAR
jgi:integrase